MSTPLDPAKAAAYGQFVAAAYDMFKANNPDPLRPAPRNIPSGWELSAWINMSDFLFQTTEAKFYGIVVHEIANPDNRIIAIRGTEGIVEWLDDAASIVMVPFRQVPSAGRVAFGFDNIYSTMKVIPVPAEAAGFAAAAEVELTGSFADQLDQLALRREAERGVAHEFAAGRTRHERPTVVTAHSLGAALGTLFVLENSVKQKFDVPLISTLASPKVGNLEFAHIFNALPHTSWRIVNSRDVVPKLPPTIPFILDYEHVNDPYPFDSSKFAKKNLGCYHNIDTYLHWLDNAIQLSPDCV
ncbi:MAG TPA: lipase family protein [Bryocella sp.]|nr:lipase family protein [Bryocella sp.]